LLCRSRTGKTTVSRRQESAVVGKTTRKKGKEMGGGLQPLKTFLTTLGKAAGGTLWGLRLRPTMLLSQYCAGGKAGPERKKKSVPGRTKPEAGYTPPKSGKLYGGRQTQVSQSTGHSTGDPQGKRRNGSPSNIQKSS